MINTLLGFWKPTSGTARVLGHDVRTEARQIRSSIGYMPENDSFIANMPAITYVRMAAELSGLPQDAALERAHEVLFYVGLGEARYRKLGAYSLGMKQMAKLAQAIVHGPDLVILDEPTNGLDPSARLRMLKLVKEMKDEHGMSVVLCSHLLRDVEEVCDEVVIMKDGLIVHQSNLEEERRSNRRFVELEVSGDDSALAAHLSALGAEMVSEGGGRWRIVLPLEFEIARLWQVTAQLNLGVRKLTHRRDSLEEIFLKAVGHLQATPHDRLHDVPHADAVAAEEVSPHGHL